MWTSPRRGDGIIVASALGQDWRSRIRHELLLSHGRGRRRLGLDGADPS
jgi:hypothetical protein